MTTKLWNVYANRVEEGLDTSLKALGLDYVDLYLVHWPVRMNDKGTLSPSFPFPSPIFDVKLIVLEETTPSSPNSPTAPAT